MVCVKIWCHICSAVSNKSPLLQIIALCESALISPQQRLTTVGQCYNPTSVELAGRELSGKISNTGEHTVSCTVQCRDKVWQGRAMLWQQCMTMYDNVLQCMTMYDNVSTMSVQCQYNVVTRYDKAGQCRDSNVIMRRIDPSASTMTLRFHS